MNTPIEKVSGYWGRVLHQLIRDPVSLFCMFILLTIIGACILAPLLTSYDPSVGSVMKRLKPIGTEGHFLGTDELGRDMFTRLLYGGRTSLIMGFVPVFIALLIGGTLGLIAGYVGGKVNTVIMRSIDVIFAFPSILLAVAIAGAMGAGIINSLVALTIVLIPSLVRITEAATTQVHKLDYVEAARSSGAKSGPIIRVHLLSNVLGPVLVYAASQLSVAIIMAAGLSFIGLGAKPPTPEWGLMLNSLRSAIYSEPVIAALPGLFIFLVSLSFNLLSDSLRSAMEIK